ncbi:hypothetical protein TorRG33x02_162680 [Trema orientale]|uniref:Uncharacterized protein n=1 Tax=Trema orientale TaxID=63057 RepID=A0A2P5EQT9_TREOI|nr:hypothetical protein TorRG33x02_162680 [Trema orientale]
MHKKTLVQQHFLLNHTTATLNSSTSSFSLLRSRSTLNLLHSQLQPAASPSSQLSHSSFSAVSLGQTQLGAPLYSHRLDSRPPVRSLTCLLTRLLSLAHLPSHSLAHLCTSALRPSPTLVVSLGQIQTQLTELSFSLAHSPGVSLAHPSSRSLTSSAPLVASLAQSLSGTLSRRLSRTELQLTQSLSRWSSSSHP